mgnify:CR=1 FL=1
MERIADSRPAANQVEVSVFGPGYGESIVIHVGNNDWIIVDSCINPSSGKPAPLEYLERIGVDPATSVSLIVATHWHDDHIRGLSRVFLACQRSDFSCSVALKERQFLALVQACGTRHMMSSSGVDEFYEILSAMEKRTSEGSISGVNPKWAIAERRLWQGAQGPASAQSTNQVYALSPSDAAVRRSLEEIARLFPVKHSPKKRLLPQSPNHFAVVIWADIRGTILLLGADLEETTDTDMGWTGILRSRIRPMGRASYFKVPHHGSSSANHPDVWTQMLDPRPLCVLTPFWRGSRRLPQRNDVRRIMGQTDEAYITADLKTKRLKRPKPVEELLRGAVRSIRPIYSSFGHIRVRSSAETAHQPLSVDLFGDAIPLKAFRGT